MNISYQAIIPAPFGAVGIMMQGNTLLGVHLLPANHMIRPELLQTHEDTPLQKVCAQIARYLMQANAPLTLAQLPQGTAFEQKVWAAIAAIPNGSTLTYSALALQIGSGARAVANACGANPLPLFIPCHRVVAKRGLGGFMQGKSSDAIDIKRWLLLHEKALQ